MGADPRDAHVLEARYANYFNVGHNLHEFLFDFGQFHFVEAADSQEADRVAIVRIVMAPTFAKAFTQMLGRALEQYEQAHGPIDV